MVVVPVAVVAIIAGVSKYTHIDYNFFICVCKCKCVCHMRYKGHKFGLH